MVFGGFDRSLTLGGLVGLFGWAGKWLGLGDVLVLDLQ